MVYRDELRGEAAVRAGEAFGERSKVYGHFLAGSDGAVDAMREALSEGAMSEDEMLRKMQRSGEFDPESAKELHEKLEARRKQRELLEETSGVFDAFDSMRRVLSERASRS